ncbi:hypothetical protein EDC04DRAFT_1557970 [Pisolithus marmoratus]|nr:hypothetical protein EDC04DRAFT_1557970 [Pisolithus marmoratus]
MFEILWMAGDKTWLPYDDISHLKALADYFEVIGVDGIGNLKDTGDGGLSDDDPQVYLGHLAPHSCGAHKYRPCKNEDQERQAPPSHPPYHRSSSSRHRYSSPPRRTRHSHYHHHRSHHLESPRPPCRASQYRHRPSHQAPENSAQRVLDVVAVVEVITHVPHSITFTDQVPVVPTQLNHLRHLVVTPRQNNPHLGTWQNPNETLNR